MEPQPTTSPQLLNYRRPNLRALGSWWIIPIVAMLHAALSFALFIYLFGSTMNRFDTNAPASLGERFAQMVLIILHVPLITLLKRGWFGQDELLFYPILIANSFCWGLAAWGCTMLLRKRHRRWE